MTTARLIRMPTPSKPTRKAKRFLRWLRQNAVFRVAVIAVIVLSSLSIGAHTFPLDTPWVVKALAILDFAITVFFVVELAVRIAAERRWYHFFTRRGANTKTGASGRGWNWFDFLIVAASLAPTGAGNEVLLGRLLRLFRVMRLVSFVPELRLLINALLAVLPRMGYVALMMFIIFYMYATLGSFLFAGINDALWGHVGRALLSLFRIATFEDWTDIMYETMAIYPLSWVYYLSFIFISAFVFLNMMIGVVVEGLQEAHNAEAQANAQLNTTDTNAIERRLARIEAMLVAREKPSDDQRR